MDKEKVVYPICPLNLFFEGDEDKCDYNILDATNIGLVGAALGVLFVSLLIVDVVPKEGPVSWVPWVGCALVSVALFISMFIRTTTETSFCRAVIAFPIQVIVGPLIILFWVFVILLIIELIGGVLERISDRRRK